MDCCYLNVPSVTANDPRDVRRHIAGLRSEIMDSAPAQGCRWGYERRWHAVRAARGTEV